MFEIVLRSQMMEFRNYSQHEVGNTNKTPKMPILSACDVACNIQSIKDLK